MIIGVIQEPSIAGIVQRLNSLDSYYDCVELRLDACKDWTLDDIATLTAPVPMLFTLRPADQGGHFTGDEPSRIRLLKQLAALNPAFMDLEYTLAAEDIQEIIQLAPKTQYILSYHDFSATPALFAPLVEEMHRKAPKAIYKVAFMAHSILDTLRLMVFCKNSPWPLVGISMGEVGETSRIMAPVFHTGFTYCPVASASAPGQLEAKELCETYNFKNLNKNTRVYGLLGDPVCHSVGHLFHNAQNRQTQENALYVKWKVTVEELPEALALLQQLAIAGASATMPLKEHLLPLVDIVDEQARQMGAINTLVWQKTRCCGYNTDASGALQALGTSVRGKTIVILGAGGSGKAIAHKALQEGAHVIVVNRSLHKAVAIGAEALPLEAIPTLATTGYQCLINTLPASVPLSFGPATFIPGSVVMDITYSANSHLLQEAKNAGCTCIDGLAMFTQQAILQRKLWGLQTAETLVDLHKKTAP